MKLRLFAATVAIACSLGLSACNAPGPSADNPESPAPSASSPETEAANGLAKDIDYLTKLSLMRGHMLVAQELLELEKPAEAEPHVGHPVEEIYADVEGQLAERGVAPFKATLMEAHDMVQNKPNDPQLQAKFNEAIAAIDGAIATLPQEQSQSLNVVLPVMNNLLDVAQAEYEAAISNNKISEAIEYQDSRGFVLYAYQVLYPNVRDTLRQSNPEAQQQIETAFEALQKAWPTAEAPAAPVMSAEEVSAQVAQIQQSAQSLQASQAVQP